MLAPIQLLKFVAMQLRTSADQMRLEERRGEGGAPARVELTPEPRACRCLCADQEIDASRWQARSHLPNMAGAPPRVSLGGTSIKEVHAPPLTHASHHPSPSGPPHLSPSPPAPAPARLLTPSPARCSRAARAPRLRSTRSSPRASSSARATSSARFRSEPSPHRPQPGHRPRIGAALQVLVGAQDARRQADHARTLHTF